MSPAYTAATATKSDFTIRYPGAAIDYVLALQEATLRARFERTGDDSLESSANAMKEAARFPTSVSLETVNTIRQTGSILNGPKKGWTLEMSRYDGSLTLYVGKDFPRIRNKNLTALIGDMVKKRNDPNYEAKVPSNPATIAAVIKLLGQHSPLIAPEPASDIVRALSKQHFHANNNKDGEAPAAFSRGATAGGQSVGTVQAAVDAIAAKWVNAPKVVVLNGVNDSKLPADLRASIAANESGSAGQVEGFIDTETTRST